MRIGVEMFGTQSGGRDRGIGRYAANLAKALLKRGAVSGHEFVFYAIKGLPTDRIPLGPNAVLKPLTPDPHIKYNLTRLVTHNPDGLDVLLFINPLEMNPGIDIPARGSRRGESPALAAVVHDLIPYIIQEQYLKRWPGTSFAWRYLWSLERLRTYDRLLTNSEATATDLKRLLNLPDLQVTTIGAAGDDGHCAFEPAKDDPADTQLLGSLGIHSPFVLSVAGPDPHKNLDGLLGAFARLPAQILQTHRLVIAAGAAEPSKLEAIRRFADERALGDRLVVMAKTIRDEELRALYRRCAAFAFPSFYEGFGLPVLEAMRCGAAVVAGNRSSIPEVAGDAALLVDTSDPDALAAALTRVLSEADLAQTLHEKGPRRAALFSWDSVADRAIWTLEEMGSGPQIRSFRSPTRTRHRRARPRIAFVSPLPPSHSGIADYSRSLITALKEHVEIDLYHDSGESPEARFSHRDCGCFDYRLLERADRMRPYRAVVYQIGNSPAHFFVEALLCQRPGVVVLHDLALASYHYEKAISSGRGLDDFRAALTASHPGRENEFEPFLADWSRHPERMVCSLTAAGFDMNGEIVAAASRVIVHSQAALERLEHGRSDRAVVIPHGAEPVELPKEKAASRAKLGLPAESMIVGCFGVVHHAKGNLEVVEAFSQLVRRMPGTTLIVVGEEADGGATRKRVGELGLTKEVRFLGRLDDDRFCEAIAATDIGVALRRPPTNGETSGAVLHLLRHGVATVVTDTGSFVGYPETAVRKVPWTDDALMIQTLFEVLEGLALDKVERASLGAAGLEYVRRHNSWSAVAAQYAAVILGEAEKGSSLRRPHFSLRPMSAGRKRGS